MISKAILIGEGSFRRAATIIVPDGVTADQIVSALNSDEANQADGAFVQPGVFSAKITGNEFPADGNKISWSVGSVSQEEDPPTHCCGCGGCAKEEDARSKLLRKVETLNRLAFEFISDKDPVGARHILKAANAFYKLAGGGDAEEAMWLLSENAFVCSLEGKHQASERWGRKAMKMALAIHGAESPIYGTVINNCAEGLLDAGNYAKAEKYLLLGIGVLNAAIAAGECNVQWAQSSRSDALGNYRRLLESTGRHEEAESLVE